MPSEITNEELSKLPSPQAGRELTQEEQEAWDAFRYPERAKLKAALESLESSTNLTNKEWAEQNVDYLLSLCAAEDKDMKPTQEQARAFALKRHKLFFDREENLTVGANFIESMADFAKLCVEKALAEREAEKWIKCEDRLPDEPKDSLSTRHFCRYTVGENYHDFDILQWWANDGWTDQDGTELDKAVTVTHYIPLPEYTEQI